MNTGVSIAPSVFVRASSGTKFGLPCVIRRRLLLPPVSRSLKPVDDTPWGWNRSFRLGALMSREAVARNAIELLTCQFNPAFQVFTALKVEYLVYRPATSAAKSLNIGTSLSNG